MPDETKFTVTPEMLEDLRRHERAKYKIAERRDGLLVTDHAEYGRQVWGLANITYKHAHDACELCGGMVGNKGYRPITNKGNRMKRICRNHETEK